MRTHSGFTINNPEHFKKQLLCWAQQYSEVVFLDSNDYEQKYSSYDAVVAVDAFTSLKTDFHDAFKELDAYQQAAQDWLFGYLSYDLKNDTEELTSGNYEGLGFAELFFFQPKKLFLLKGNQLEIQYLKVCDDEIDTDINEIRNVECPEILHATPGLHPTIEQRITKDQYLSKASKMLEHIQRGDIYEANLCMEFYADGIELPPLETYLKLNSISVPPFAAFVKNSSHYLMCASPERFLRMEADKIISQPIKGTARRSGNADEDEAIKKELAANEKERSENIMITDLVRNDLSRTAAKGTVTVEELCVPYTFRQVHHLISTVASAKGEGFTPVAIIKAAFPMGSMTGAPKISAMKIIEQLEETKRGLYSGAVGYFTPGGDFDFNVVIRSILYNAETKYASFSVGSAITALADPEKEYEECFLKAGAMLKAFT